MPHTQRQLDFQRLAALLGEALPAGAPAVAAPALPGAAAALTALALRRLHPESWLVAVTAGPREMEALQADILVLAAGQDEPPLLLPPPASGPGKEEDLETGGARMAAARRLAGAGAAAPALLVTTVAALLAPLPAPEALLAAEHLLRRGEERDFSRLVAELAGAGGYRRVSEVAAKGQMAVRGGLLDIWPPGAPLPARIEFAGNAIESLRSFDPATQRSLERLESLRALPCDAAALGAVSPAAALPAGAVLLWLDHGRLAEAAAGRSPEDASGEETWRRLLAETAARAPARQIFSGDPPPPRIPTMRLAVAAAPGIAAVAEDDPSNPGLRLAARQRLLAGLNARAEAGDEVVVFIDTAGGCEWLARELPPDSRIAVRQGMLSAGCEWPALRLVLLGQSDLYGARGRPARPAPPAGRGERLERGEDLQPGELVVHVEHGIGLFEGIAEIVDEGRRTEVLTIRYAGGARLRVPLSQVHLLSRYVGIGDKETALHRLGGRRWLRERAAAERAVADLAAQLLETQARRSLRAGASYDIEPPWMRPFEETFPFAETPDQQRCIADVKRDLAAPRPMDRLICGDAGYGKTEVAMRAAFIVVMAGRQVAVLTPTTVLAEQHEATFRERMAAFPVRIETLSRFCPRGRRAAILADLAAGRVDIVIGTHALIQPGVRFKDLGLAIIDEEQRFGVAHKERLKQVRELVDVLTLSATPIPRTLYLSMTGARDMSLLQTPPRERLAIETRVARDSDDVIREAIRRETARGGQVYFLHNRVLTIGLMLRRLRRIVPEARIAMAHGQLPAGTLAETMRRFAGGDCDVLLCTTIVESGLDIPRANTIIIHRADRLGLADLYQLRGRVGRGARRGFAWLLLPPRGHIDEEARRRIGALQRHGGLGGGLDLALRDLEIRGAGNLLGAEQSGHIAAVGFGLYCQLLRRTVARLRGDPLPPLVDVELRLDFIAMSAAAPGDAAAGLPRAYIGEEAGRLQAHRRIAEAAGLGEIRAIREELADRYGRPPPEAVRLLRLAELRILAAERGIARIETRGETVRLFRRDGRPAAGPDGRLPRLRGRSADQKLAALFRAVGAAGEQPA
jgi:transcription-repair coupling factor (superfamily II helicase)